MTSVPTTDGAGVVAVEDVSIAGAAWPGESPSPPSCVEGTEAVETLALLEETLAVSKRKVLTGTVRVSTRTEAHDEIAEVTLDRNVVDVTRVPVGQIVDVAPGVRTEGETTIVPVIEERLVVVKQLYLREEIHIRHHVESDVARLPIQLRRQTAVVERLDAEGRVVFGDAVPQA